MRFYPGLLACVFLASCARAPLKDPAGAFRRADPSPPLADSYPIGSLREALAKTLKAYASSTTIPPEFNFAGRVIPREGYRAALERLLPELENWERFHGFFAAHFDLFEVYGDERWGEIYSTGYFDVSMQGSRVPTARHSEPIYRLPGDMANIDLKAYGERMPDVKPLQDLLLEQRSKNPVWRGRVVSESPYARIVPYYQRSEIQRQRPLAGKQLELAYVDPVDAFFLEIQGSGVVEFSDGSRLRLGYAGQNGAPYTAIGKFLWDIIPKELMSMQRIRRHLETLSREQQQELFDKNASFVFFKPLDGDSLGYSGAELTPMRGIATDQFLFPKGTLALLDVELPVFSDAEALDPAAWEPKPRWVFDLDTGGAIRGGGRVDLYTGRGPEAARIAGVMKRKGRLWVAAPKPEFLAELSRGKDSGNSPEGRTSP